METQPKNKRQVWRYGVHAVGVKKRCRKVDFHTESERRGLAELNEVDEEKAKALAKAWIAQNMKSFTKAFATITLWTIDDEGFQTWEPMNKDHNLKFQLH